MKRRSIVSVLLILLIINVVILGKSNSNPVSNQSLTRLQMNDLVPHEKIQIFGNNDFNEFPGTGTGLDPYVISNLEIISPVSEDYNLIFIANTDVYFIVENNYLSGEDHNNGFGIFLENVENGLIRNNVIIKVTHGPLQITNSRNNVIETNVISDNEMGHGIELFESNNNIIRHNTITFNGGDGIASYFSNNNDILNNTLSMNGLNGIRLELSDSHYIWQNNISFNIEGGVYLGSAMSNIVISNDITSNPTGISILTEEAAESSSGNIIIQNYLWNNIEGIFIMEGIENTISQNLIDGSREVGILINDGTQINVNHNIISNSVVGIRSAGDSMNNNFECNVFQDNLNYGVLINPGSEFERIYQNDFVNNRNEPQALDNGFSNTFERNYWSETEHLDQDGDGINDLQYSIAGDSGNVDDQSVVRRNNDPEDVEAVCNLDSVTGLTSTTIQLISGLTNPNVGEPQLVLPISNMAIYTFIFVTTITVGAFIILRSGRSPKSGSEAIDLTSIANEIGFDEFEGIGSLNKTPLSGLCVTCGTYSGPTAQFCIKCDTKFN